MLVSQCLKVCLTTFSSASSSINNLHLHNRTQPQGLLSGPRVVLNLDPLHRLGLQQVLDKLSSSYLPSHSETRNPKTLMIPDPHREPMRGGQPESGLLVLRPASGEPQTTGSSLICIRNRNQLRFRRISKTVFLNPGCILKSPMAIKKKKKNRKYPKPYPRNPYHLVCGGITRVF